IAMNKCSDRDLAFVEGLSSARTSNNLLARYSDRVGRHQIDPSRTEPWASTSPRRLAATAAAIFTFTALVSLPSQSWAQAGAVAAYSFNEGAGTTVGDISGNNNNGTISGATWSTSGKFGNALVFNGTNARVTVANSTSLGLTTAMTLEAWVFPT